jgi:hypothetical protein
MRVLISVFLTIALGFLVLAGCAAPPASELASEPAAEAAAPPVKPPWLLASEDEVRQAELLLVTVPLDQPETLKRLGVLLQQQHKLQLVAEWPLKTIGIHCLVFEAPMDRNIDDVLGKLRADDRVRTAAPMQEYRTLSRGKPRPTLRKDYTGLQTSLRDMGVLAGHRVATGEGVKIGIVDTGIDPDHPDLSGQVTLWKDFTGREAPDDPVAEIHGTAIAGIVAAEAVSGRGITGIAPSAKILALRGCWQEDGKGLCSTFSLAQAINFAMLNEVDVLNLSLTGPEDPLIRELLEEAARRNIFIVAADRGDPGGSFPASMPEVVGVTQLTAARSPELSAPSVDILSTAPGGAYDFFSGSSVASAHVSGLVALLRGVRPDLSLPQLMKALNLATPSRSVAPNTCLALQSVCSIEGGAPSPACALVGRCASS